MYFKKLDEFLQFRNDHKSFLHAKQKNGLFMLKSIFSEAPELAFVSNENEDPDISEHDEASKSQRKRYRLIHRRFGHYGSEALRHLHEVASGIKKISIPEKEKRICESCKIGKMKRKISKELEVHKDKVLAQISIDIAGPFVMSIRGFEYFLQIADSYSRKIWTIPLKTKDQAILALREWKLLEERKTSEKLIASVRRVRGDNAPELKKIMDEWQKKDGVSAQYTRIASSHQNGAAERAIQTTENAIRTMTHTASLPAEFWCFAAETDAHVRNRLARGPKINGKRTSPEEAYTGIKQKSDHLKVWRCICYVHRDPKTIPVKQLHNKQANRGRQAVFWGYSNETTKQYWYYSADLGYVQRSSSIEFDENSKGGRLDLRLRNLPSQVTGHGTHTGFIDLKPRGRPRKFSDDNQQQLTSHSSPNEQIESQQLNVEQPSTQDIELVDAPEIAPSPKLPAIQQEPVDNTIKISGDKITFELPTIAEPSAVIKNDEALDGKCKVTVASENATSSTQLTTSKDEKRRKEKKSSGQKKKKSKDKALGKEKRRRKADELETTETSKESQELVTVCEEINSQPSTNNESLPLESSKINEAEVTAQLLSKQLESQATMDLDSESEDDHWTTKKKDCTGIERENNDKKVVIPASRYFFRPRKRSGNGDEDERQAKRIRAMISFFKNQRNKLVEADQLEHALAAMAQPQIYGKKVRKGIFKGLYALFCRIPDNDEDYALQAKIIQGIKIPRTYKEAMRSPQAKEWEEAIKTEIDQLIMNGTWEEMLLPKGANLVSTKWGFTIKETVNGNIERFKARLVARGFSQS
ncbi:hypothetical protein K3495_g8405 [Podosphaera aphanis]|nr:hypothetical protein K3495_g8405 [Podosphaera aphanis]